MALLFRRDRAGADSARQWSKSAGSVVTQNFTVAGHVGVGDEVYVAAVEHFADEILGIVARSGVTGVAGTPGTSLGKSVGVYG